MEAIGKFIVDLIKLIFFMGLALAFGAGIAIGCGLIPDLASKLYQVIY